MPHYKDGTGARVGDEVTITFEVTAVYEGETACNVSLKGVGEVEGELAPFLVTNTKWCELVSQLDVPDAQPHDSDGDGLIDHDELVEKGSLEGGMDEAGATD